MKKIGVFVLLLVMAVSAVWGQSSEERLGSLLIEAAENQNLDELKRALNGGANPNYKTANDDFALLIAAREQWFAGLKELLSVKYNCSANETNAFGQTAIMILAEQADDLSMIRLLKNAKAKTDQIDNKKMTVLMYATKNQNDEIFDYFLDDCGASANKKDRFGNTAGMWAVKNGNIHALKMLLNTPGVDWTAADTDGKNAFMIAVESNNPEAVNLILNSKNFSKFQKDNMGRPILIWMIDTNQDPELIVNLMNNMDPNTILNMKDNSRKTVRDWAIMRDNDAVLNKLDEIERKQQKLKSR